MLQREHDISTSQPIHGRYPPLRALYVCYASVDEPLVRTQVLPYLRELVRGGIGISLLTFEPDFKMRWTTASIADRRQWLQQDGIAWHLLPYHKRPSPVAKLWDIAAGWWVSTRIARKDRVQIIHGRSHVGAAIGLLAKAATGARVIFDIRGLLAEEYREMGHWKAGGTLFRVVKAAERWLCRSADGFVVLTARAREMLFPCGAPRGQPVELIPCCVNAQRFAGLALADREALRAQLGIAERLVFIHAGKLGGPYLIRETGALLAAARQADPRTYVLVITQSSAAPLVDELEAVGFSSGDYRIFQAAPEEVPRYLHAADVGLLIVRASTALAAASPTKFAEYLAAGLPVVASSGIGDLDMQIDDNRVGVRLSTFDRENCLAAIRTIVQLRHDPELGARCRTLASVQYDLCNVGAPRYRRLYTAVLNRMTPPRIRVLALASYPIQAAATRYRIGQFIGPLAQLGIDVQFASLLDRPLFEALYTPRRLLTRLSRLALRVLRQFAATLQSLRADVLFVQREAMLFGPPLLEWIAVRLLRRPLLLDLDDATYIAYASPVYGRFATALKWPNKTDTLIRWSRVVTCGNANIAAYVRSRGANAVVLPTVADKSRFRPGQSRNGIPLIGWIGTHGTYPFFERLLPVFERLARDVSFRLMIVGSGRDEIHVPGVNVTVRRWELVREAEDFRSLDIGVYPLPDDQWSASKSGLKAILYMLSGVPSVVSPVGVCATVGCVGHTHLTAVTDDEWLARLRLLVSDAELRTRIGRTAREFAVRHYAIEQHAESFASIIRTTVA